MLAVGSDLTVCPKQDEDDEETKRSLEVTGSLKLYTPPLPFGGPYVARDSI